MRSDRVHPPAQSNRATPLFIAALQGQVEVVTEKLVAAGVEQSVAAAGGGTALGLPGGAAGTTQRWPSLEHCW
eukprot:3150190-Rhodomonas_salina.1